MAYMDLQNSADSAVGLDAKLNQYCCNENHLKITVGCNWVDDVGAPFVRLRIFVRVKVFKKNVYLIQISETVKTLSKTERKLIIRKFK